MFNKIFKLVINFSYMFILLYLLMFKNISNFIHPRMMPYLIATIIVLSIFFVLNLISKVHKHEEKIHFTSIIYLLPVLALLFIGDGNISESLIKNKGVIIGTSNISSIDNIINDNNNNDIVDNDEEKIKPDLIINDYKYSYMLDKISNNIDDYYGDIIEVKGFIFKDKSSMDKNQFMIARLYMVCCVADLQTIGYLCEYENILGRFKENDWVKILAKIDKTYYEGNVVPYLKVLNIENIKKPLEQYVY